MRVFALLLVLLLAPAGARAQDGSVDAPPTVSARPAGGSAIGSDQTATVPASSGLPAPNEPPRTLRAYWHLFAAFVFAWLMILGYAISLARRFRRLEERIGALPGDAR